MKHEYSKDRLSYFLRLRIHGNVFAWNKSASKPERSKQVTENIMRWEDDGGPVSENGYPRGTDTACLMAIDSGTGVFLKTTS